MNKMAKSVINVLLKQNLIARRGQGETTYKEGFVDYLFNNYKERDKFSIVSPELSIVLKKDNIGRVIK